MDWIIAAAVVAVLLFLIYLKATGLMKKNGEKPSSTESRIFEAELEPETVTEKPQTAGEAKKEPETFEEPLAEQKQKTTAEDQWEVWTNLAGRWQMSEAEIERIVKMLTEEEVGFLLGEYQKRCGIVFREVNSKDASWENDPAKKVIGMRIKLLLKAQKEFKKKRK